MQTRGYTWALIQLEGSGRKALYVIACLGNNGVQEKQAILKKEEGRCRSFCISLMPRFPSSASLPRPLLTEPAHRLHAPPAQDRHFTSHSAFPVQCVMTRALCTIRKHCMKLMVFFSFTAHNSGNPLIMRPAGIVLVAVPKGQVSSALSGPAVIWVS